MKAKIEILKVIVVSITLLASCNTVADKSSKFLGTWERPDKPQHPMVISRSGDNFIVQMPNYDAGDGRYRGDDKNSASYIQEQDKLELSFRGLKLDMIYDEATHHLLFSGKEYSKKTKESEMLKLTEEKSRLEKKLEFEKQQLDASNQLLDTYEKSPDSPEKDESIQNLLINLEGESAQLRRTEEQLKELEQKIEDLRKTN